jgi:hypothetical protein
VVTGASVGCGELDERVERCRQDHVGVVVMLVLSLLL